MFVRVRSVHRVASKTTLVNNRFVTRPRTPTAAWAPSILARPQRCSSHQAISPSPVAPLPTTSPISSSTPHKAATTTTYVPPTKGILSKLPPAWVPFAELSRIEKPGGLYGFYMAYLIGLGYGACLVTPAVPPTRLAEIAAVLLVYNVFLRGAACTVNDVLDRHVDRLVARCRNRPVARGAVTPAGGYAWYAAQTVGAGAAIACLPSPMLALAYAVPIQLSVSLYPLGKRFTDFPQLILSAPIAGGVLMAAASLGLDPFSSAATGFLFMSHYIWTTIFDYVNACQDTEDDVKAGVRSMAVRYRDTTAFISVLGAAQVGCLVATGVMAGLSPVYMTIAAGGNALWLAVMAKTVKRSRPDICAWWFSWGGLLVSGTTATALFAEYYGRRIASEEEQKEEGQSAE